MKVFLKDEISISLRISTAAPTLFWVKQIKISKHSDIPQGLIMVFQRGRL